MNKTLTIALILLLILVTIATTGGAVYFYSRFTKITSEKSDLESRNEDLETEIASLEERLSEEEEESDEEEDEGTDETGEESPGINPCINKSNDGEIEVTKPCTNDSLGSSFQITGKARVFEATFQVNIISKTGQLLYQGTYMTRGGDIGLLNPFNETVNWSSPGSGSGTINFYELSAKDGSVEHLVSIPVKFE